MTNEIDSLKKKKVAAQGRMNRADKVRQHMLSKLCRVNAEYYKARGEYLHLDREIADHFVEEVTTTKAKKSGVSGELAQLTSEQLSMLAQMIEQKKEEDRQFNNLKEEEEEK